MNLASIVLSGLNAGNAAARSRFDMEMGLAALARQRELDLLHRRQVEQQLGLRAADEARAAELHPLAVRRDQQLYDQAAADQLIQQQDADRRGAIYEQGLSDRAAAQRFHTAERFQARPQPPVVGFDLGQHAEGFARYAGEMGEFAAMPPALQQQQLPGMVPGEDRSSTLRRERIITQMRQIGFEDEDIEHNLRQHGLRPLVDPELAALRQMADAWRDGDAVAFGEAQIGMGRAPSPAMQTQRFTPEPTAEAFELEVQDTMRQRPQWGRADAEAFVRQRGRGNVNQLPAAMGQDPIDVAKMPRMKVLELDLADAKDDLSSLEEQYKNAASKSDQRAMAPKLDEARRRLRQVRGDMRKLYEQAERTTARAPAEAPQAAAMGPGSGMGGAVGVDDTAIDQARAEARRQLVNEGRRATPQEVAQRATELLRRGR